ncbi:hypothetical protein M409DRAFT_20514 [Zasmidium cellare ATCC 36951]|uniref:SnoaL-like domain-containing protein n=1 Tax=Zasmidium cellare ATCC 36951 TaxID=1080233 RepID=A0A6A6CSX1_ZASCE|nr:uncharacterized protein M409DRAFT_20514 [Zasmidium cellare ATCC 36951]KAF2169288.1 hypothetical protein M409DRAFT_20514 [Zasmidium cellare ATCC 36951]
MASHLPPRLPRSLFLQYISHFNTRSYALQHAFYSPTITMTLPDPLVPTLHGPEEISRHYAQVHSVAEETVVPVKVLCEGEGVFLEMEVFFRYIVDTDQGVHGRTAREGDVFKVVVWAVYDIDAVGKMRRIRCSLWDERMLGQVDVGECVREARGRAMGDLRGES